MNFFSSVSCCCCWSSSAPLTVLLPEEDKAEVETRLRKIREWSSRDRGQEVKTEDEGPEEDLSGVESENEEKKMELSVQVKKKPRRRSLVWKYFKKCPKVKSIFVYSEGICSTCKSSFSCFFCYSSKGCAGSSIVDPDPRYGIFKHKLERFKVAINFLNQKWEGFLSSGKLLFFQREQPALQNLFFWGGGGRAIVSFMLT